MASRLRERGTKRVADYVPKPVRDELHNLSKADLMEIAWDYAIRSVGEDVGTQSAYTDLRDTAQTLSGGRDDAAAHKMPAGIRGS